MRIAVAGGTGVLGRHVVAAVEGAGHEALVLTRATGVDLVAGTGLDRLAGVDTVIDVTSVATSSARRSVTFFTTITRNLLRAGARFGVQHHLACSITGAAAVNAGYHAGKKAQEDLVLATDCGTVVRSTQFHEFAGQMASQLRVGPLQLAPNMLSRPIAAAEVGSALAGIAAGPPQGLGPEYAGPEVLRMADMIRQLRTARGHRGPVLEVSLPGPFGRGARDGTLLPGPGARLGTTTFATWLERYRDDHETGAAASHLSPGHC